METLQYQEEIKLLETYGVERYKTIKNVEYDEAKLIYEMRERLQKADLETLKKTQAFLKERNLPINNLRMYLVVKQIKKIEGKE